MALAALHTACVPVHDSNHMKILVLGSGGRAACHHCVAHAARAAHAAPAPDARPAPSREPCAVAVAGTEDRWVLLNAAPEIVHHARIDAAAQCGQIAGVVLLDAQLDHAASLAALCRSGPLNLYATPAVFEALSCRLRLLGLPDAGSTLRWHLLPVAGDVRRAEFQVDGIASLRFVALDDGGWASPSASYRPEAVVGDSIAVLVENRRAGQRLVYSPGRNGAARPWMEGADCPLAGAAGIELAFDGMEIVL